MTEDKHVIMEDQPEGEAIQTHAAKIDDNDPSVFYHQPDSIYIRVRWVDDINSFAMSVRNELLYPYQDNPDAVPEIIIRLGAFVRGMVELGMAYPSKCYSIGVDAQSQDYLAMATENMPEEHKVLMEGGAKGRA